MGRPAAGAARRLTAVLAALAAGTLGMLAADAPPKGSRPAAHLDPMERADFAL